MSIYYRYSIRRVIQATVEHSDVGNYHVIPEYFLIHKWITSTQLFKELLKHINLFSIAKPLVVNAIHIMRKKKRIICNCNAILREVNINKM